MNKQELIEALKEEYNDYHPEYNYDIRTGLAYAIKLAHQLDEPTKVEPLVVPEGLGEWLDHVNLGNEGSLFSIIGELKDMWVSDGFEVFITDNKKQLIEVIIGTRPYEVEQEKLYYVLNKHGQTLLVFIGGAVCLSSGYPLRESNKDKYQLTENQIKDYDPRYWSFAVEVAE